MSPDSGYISHRHLFATTAPVPKRDYGFFHERKRIEPVRNLNSLGIEGNGVAVTGDSMFLCSVAFNFVYSRRGQNTYPYAICQILSDFHLTLYFLIFI